MRDDLICQISVVRDTDCPCGFKVVVDGHPDGSRYLHDYLHQRSDLFIEWARKAAELYGRALESYLYYPALNEGERVVVMSIPKDRVNACSKGDIYIRPGFGVDIFYQPSTFEIAPDIIKLYEAYRHGILKPKETKVLGIFF
jgi:hypothetical protein